MENTIALYRLGKIFLAYMTEEEVEESLKTKGLPYYTKNTITDPEKLKTDLLIVKREGVARDNEEFEVGQGVWGHR